MYAQEAFAAKKGDGQRPLETPVFLLVLSVMELLLYSHRCHARIRKPKARCYNGTTTMPPHQCAQFSVIANFGSDARVFVRLRGCSECFSRMNDALGGEVFA